MYITGCKVKELLLHTVAMFIGQFLVNVYELGNIGAESWATIHSP